MAEFVAAPARRASLRLQLLLFLMVPMLVLLLLDAALTYTVALRYSERVHDRDLAEDARSLASWLGSGAGGTDPTRRTQSLLEYGITGYDYFAISSTQHGQIAGNAYFPTTPSPRADAPGSVFDVNIDGEPLRAATARAALAGSGGDVISVTIAESLQGRRLHAREILLLAVPLQAVLIVCVLVLVWFGVSLGLRSLTPLTRKLADRERQLAPVTDDDVPREILPLTRTIDLMFARLRRAMEVQEHFIADAAHQLRTPLSGLRLHVERALADPRPETVRDALEHIERLTGRASRTATQLLALTRAQSPLDTSSSLGPLDLSRVVPPIVTARVHEALRAGIDLGYQGPETPLVAFAEEAGLHEVLDNLIDNALRYAGRGSTVTVSIARRDADTVALVVEDDGPGVSPPHLERLGERFYRAPGAAEGGTGLGLAIVQRIVQRLRGRVEFARAEFGGLRVTIVLPSPETPT